MNSSVPQLPVIEKNQIVFSTNVSQQQYYSLPSDVIKFILKNISSPDLYEKFIQTCKYFFSKKSVIVHQRGLICSKHGPPSKRLGSPRHQRWIKEGLICDAEEINLLSVSKLLLKVYRCNLEMLWVLNQQLSFDEYLLLTSSKTIKDFEMRQVTISYPNSSSVPFEILMEQLPNVKHCVFLPKNDRGSYFTPETAKNLLNLPAFTDLELLKLYGIHEGFDFVAFCEFIKSNPKSVYIIVMYHPIPEEYHQSFKNFVDKLSNKWQTDVQKPRVHLLVI